MLSDAFLSRLDTMMLAMKGRASGGAGGTRRSRQTGSSAEFSDYREYIPGDDIRRIDWNAMARFDRIFLKLFMEEQESAVTVLLDGSGSMGEKWTAARQAAEAVAAVQVRPATAAEKGIQPRATSCRPTIHSSSICLKTERVKSQTHRGIVSSWKMLPMIQTPIMGRTGGENSGMHGCKKTAVRFGFVQETVSFKTAELTKYHTSMMN